VSRPLSWAISAAVVLVIVGGYVAYRSLRPSAVRLARLHEFWEDPQAHADWLLHAGERCGEAPFVAPTDGYIGFFWGDVMRLAHRHQGIDIFGPTGPDGLGQTPVVAAYSGYLTRLPTWHSAVIIRIPQDPLRPGRQICTYYTHMADPQGNSFIDPAFPAGTSELFVPAGTHLGYQGNYSADPSNPTGIHLHFSIVLDDGTGGFRNELEIQNTLDPSPYLGFDVNAATVGGGVAVCSSE
jgi:murein DD-endopeptidase MepM/ murein hydrolase activator NlpD